MWQVAVDNRPTLPDSLPVIGPAKGVRGLLLATGHQHVGLNTATGTADLLGTDGKSVPQSLKLHKIRRKLLNSIQFLRALPR